MDFCDAPSRRDLFRPSRENQSRFPTALPDDFHFLPAKSPTRSHRFEKGFLRGQPSGVMDLRPPAGLAELRFPLQEDPSQKALSVFLQQSRHPVYVAQVDPEAQDHLVPPAALVGRKDSKVADPSEPILRKRLPSRQAGRTNTSTRPDGFSSKTRCLSRWKCPSTRVSDPASPVLSA